MPEKLVQEIQSINELPRDELVGPVTAGTLEEAEKKAEFYGLTGFWCRSNLTLYLVPSGERGSVKI